MKLILLPPLDRPGERTPITESPALGYLGAYLEAHGYEVECLEPRLRRLDDDAIADHVGRSGADLVGFSILDNVRSVYRVAAALRTRGSRAHITVGGQLATFAHEKILEECRAIDSVVRFEGEQPLLALAAALDGDGDVQAVPGLAFRRGATVCENAPARMIDDLDTLPAPKRYLPAEYYEQNLFHLIASRGCHFRCTFCGVHRFYTEAPGRTKRYHSPEYVASQMEELTRRYANNRFWFMDDDPLGTSSVERRWAAGFIEELQARGLDVVFSLMCRIDTLNQYPDLLERLRGVGLRRAFVGIENVAEDPLRRINKGTRTHGLAYLESARMTGVELIGGMILFDRTTTEAELRTNLSFIDEHADELQFNYDMLKVYHGTALYDSLDAEGLLRGSWDNATYEFERPTIAAAYGVFRGFKALFWKQLDLPLRGAVWWHIGLPEPPYPVEWLHKAMGIYNRLAVRVLRLALEAAARSSAPHAGEIFEALLPTVLPDVEDALFAVKLATDFAALSSPSPPHAAVR